MSKQSWSRVKRTAKEGGGIYPGLRYREHPERKHGISPDRYYVLTHKVEGKTITEACGWASDGWTPTKCAELLRKLKENAKTGQGARTLRELRKTAEDDRIRIAAESTTLDEFWPRYFAHSKATKKMASALKEESHFRLWLSPLFGPLPLRQIGMNQWDSLVELLNKAGKSPRTKEYITGTLRRILKAAYHRRLVAEAPPAGKRIGVTGPGNSNRRLRVISPSEAEAILFELKERDIHAWRIAKFAFLTGCRASEAFSLRWRDVDLARGAVTFPETKNRDARALPLSAPLRDLLAPTEAGAPEQYVFVKSNGTPYEEAPAPFKTVVNEILNLNDGRAKRDRISFHSIRHTVATNLAKVLNLRDLMDVMGWRTVQMAMRYVKGDEQTQARALAGLENGLTTSKAKVLPFNKLESRSYSGK